MATQVVTEQIEDIQQLVRTPRRITRSALAQAHEDGNFIEELPNTDLAEKCNDIIAKKLINIREAHLKEANILPVSKEFMTKFLNNFTPTSGDEKLIEAEGRSKPFPVLKLKNSKGELIFKFLGTYSSSNHDFGKLIYTLSKDF